MALYEIEWTETTKKRAVIEAPPNDDRMLDAAKEILNVAGTPMPRLIAWAIADNKVERRKNSDGLNDVETTITLIAEVYATSDHRRPL